MSEDLNSTATPPALSEAEIAKRAGARIDPILAHLKVPDITLDKNIIRELFIKMWDFEKGESLPPEEQYLTTVGLFIYYAHNVLDDLNIKTDKARECVVGALASWLAPETEKAIEIEKVSGNAFHAFVQNSVPKVDEIYTWRNFLLEHKKSDPTEWTYKMKRCWFSEFFIRMGHTSYIQTACMFDQIPAEARKDYVKLRLQNLFQKLGSSCQFTYTPVKK